MAYQLVNDIDGNATTIRFTNDDGKVKFIPVDEANTDYQEYLQFLADGGVPEEADN